MFWGLLAVVFTIVAVFESGIAAMGMLTGDKGMEFVLMTVMELLTVVMIPVALRLFKTRRVSEDLGRRKEAALMSWGAARMLMLGCPLVINTLLYYLFMQTTFGYLAIIILICMVFVYPGRDRCDYEVKSMETHETDGNHR